MNRCCLDPANLYPSSMFPCFRFVPLSCVTGPYLWVLLGFVDWDVIPDAFLLGLAMFSKVTLLEATNDVGGHAKTWVDKDRGVLGGYATGCVGARSLTDLSWYEHVWAICIYWFCIYDVSNAEHPGWLGYKGIILPRYIGIMIKPL